MVADLGWTKYISDVEKAAEGGLYVQSISWEKYPGDTEADEVADAIELAIRDLSPSLQAKIKEIIIARGQNPNE